ncbi:MAG: TSUP family transporter [Tissierellia bacterium]|nr:TSUP family transporter [Tissierellia bacterium]
MNINWLFLLPAAFMAAFVDAVAGGGGIISIPSFMIAGFPTHIALGTNKFSMSTGTIISTYRYYKDGKVEFKLLKYLIPFSLIGSVLGVLLVLKLSTEFLQPMIMVLLIVVGIYSFFSKSQGLVNEYKGMTNKNIIKGIVFAFLLGFYDGFFGPGTGSFIIFGLIKIFGFDYVRASGNSKVLNLTSNLAALVTFALNGKIIFLYAIPTALVMMAGGYIGSTVALKGGVKLIKPFFVIMALAAAAKILIESLT